jgi:hypothetical protein
MRKISRIEMPRLQKLKIKFPRLKILAENFQEMSRNMANLKHLHISNQSIGVLGALITNFKNLETLVVGCDSDSSEVVDFPIGELRHDTLKELCIYSSYTDQKSLKCCKSVLQTINESLVNLEKIKLHNVITLNVQQFSELLKSHESLTHVSIESIDEETKFNLPFLEVLRVSGAHLQYFQSRGLEIPIHRKVIEKKFRKMFSSIKIRPWMCQVVMRNCKWQHAAD